MIKFEQVIKVVDRDHELAEDMSRQLDISPLTATVLVNRRITSLKEARDFLSPSLDKLVNPFLLKDMDKAVHRIALALEEYQNVWIYGDYDVDGVTSTSVLMIFLKKLGFNPSYYIPDRMTEGYGLNKEAIDYIKDKNGQLIITVDCGITSFDVAKYCKEKNIDLIITDHHQCGEDIPIAEAVINPNREDCKYPFKKLAGVGVAFKLVQALSQFLEVDIDYNELLPIVAIGTVADVVSLTGENRVIVKNGLETIKGSKNLGIKALLDITGLQHKDVSSGHIGFVIGPRINAGGRIGLAKYGVELFTSEASEDAKTLAERLDLENNKRQNIEKEILSEAIEIIERDIDLENEKIIVLASENWHHGVIGIVSSRITERYNRPSILISIEGDEGRGSARSISSFDIYDGLKQCEDLFIKFGGHEQAAGLSIEKDKVYVLRERINEIAREILTDEDLIPEVYVDREVDTKNVTKTAIKELDLLQPFGIDNSSPQFLIRNANVKLSRTIGKENKHLKLLVEKEGKEFDCIGFRLGALDESIEIGDSIDLVVSLEINEYRNNEKIQLNIKQLLIANKQDEELENKYYFSLYKSLDANKIVAEDKNGIIAETLIDNDRVKTITKALNEEEGILVLVNNLFNMKELLRTLQLQGKSIIRKTEITFNFCSYSKSNSIILNPIISKIDFSRFKEIYIYDLLFDKSNLNKIVGKNNTLKVLVDNKDIKRNCEILENVVPTINDLRTVYKSFITQGKSVLKINSEQYVSYVNKNSSNNLSRIKLEVSLDVLQDSKLIKCKADGEDYYIKLCEGPNEKIDISSTPKYNYLCQIKNSTLYG